MLPDQVVQEMIAQCDDARKALEVACEPLKSKKTRKNWCGLKPETCSYARAAVAMAP